MSTLALMLANELSELINRHAKPKELGRAAAEIVFILDVGRDLRRRPDVAYVSASRWPLDRLTPWESDWAIAPELAVEIISPGNSMRDMMRKTREYFQHGVSEVWLVLPDEQSVQIFTGPKSIRILDADDTLSTPLIPGWTLKISDWLPELPAGDETARAR